MSTQKRLFNSLDYGWVVLIVVFLVSAAAPLNQFKVPPMMPTLMETFQLELSMAGLLMSIFAITGVIMALPASYLLQRMGPKIAGLIAAGCMVIGAAIGALSGNPGQLLVSRVIEGIGMVLIAVVAPAAVGMWFPPERRGVPLGIWATWVPVGRIIMYNAAPPLGTNFSWQAVWWFGSVFSLVAFLLYWIFFRTPPDQNNAQAESINRRESPNIRSLIKNRQIWLLFLAFCCYNFAFLSFNTFFPTFLVSVWEYPLAKAGLVTSLTSLTIISSPLGGFLSDRIGSRKTVYSIFFLLFSFLWLLPFNVQGWMIPAFAVLLGLIAGPIPPAIFSAVPDVMGRAQMIGIGMAVIAMGQSLGVFLGPVLFGKVVENFGWVSAGYMLIPICLLGFFAGWLAKVR
jgi:predicted MFS family arabinose efflux permease